MIAEKTVKQIQAQHHGFGLSEPCSFGLGEPCRLNLDDGLNLETKVHTRN